MPAFSCNQGASINARAKAGLLAEAIYNNDYKTQATLTHLRELALRVCLRRPADEVRSLTTAS